MSTTPAPQETKISLLTAAKTLVVTTTPLPAPSPTELQIEIKSTTLCGSDLHYYTHYRNGDIHVREPLVLGHEASGIVIAVGSGENGKWKVGDRVALEVGVPCGDCAECLCGRYNICAAVRFRSSGKSLPHFAGTLQEVVNHPARWCHKLPDTVSYTSAALLEPLSVAIHATRRVRKLGTLGPGSSILILGAGAVGLLVAAMCKVSGASRIVVSDINPGRTDFAIQHAFATHAHTPPREGKRPESVDERLAYAKVSAGGFDVTFECTGVEICTQTGIYAARPGGSLVLLGMGNPVQTLPISAAALREVDILGGFRYANTYKEGIEILRAGLIPQLEEIVTHKIGRGVCGVEDAFEMAGKQVDDVGALVIKVECVFGS
ncbi:GroES-like protein [Choiromyces venosus 120613-1]|uniref:GroES-like protein n=1 Tax=Choiromyces venosus 120613-1 TaxID=1336337 RepID=A0A3N4JNJ5_9PEZI|nr:GroES-like protein [Choiromyces venosus 120613-1]